MSWTTLITKGFGSCSIQVPELHVLPTMFVETIHINDIVDIGTLRINNTGTGILNWTANIDVNWITMSFMSGNLNEFALDTPIITINSVGISLGQHNGIITINSNGGTKDISVQMNVILPPFGSVIRSTTSPNTRPNGIGGDSLTIWHCDVNVDRIYEMSTVDFSVIRSTASPGVAPLGIGGDSSTIWHCDNFLNRIYEFSIVDLSIIRLTASPGEVPIGIGGDGSVIWHCDWYTRKVYELSTIDFSVIRSTASPGTRADGIGGDSSTIWHCDWHTHKVYELSTVDLSVIRLTASPSIYPDGIGGDNSTIWYCNCHTNKIYELFIG